MKTVTIAACLLLPGWFTLSYAAPDRNEHSVSPTDPLIAEAVKRRLMFEPTVISNDVNVNCLDGVVTLTGQVDSLRGKLRATEVASSRRGVLSVINRIDVLSPAQPDLDIETGVSSALQFDTITRPRNIEAAVNDGIVTLSGSVETYGVKRLAEQIATDISGVKGVENQIEVTTQSTLSEEELEVQLRRTLNSDIYIDTAFMNIEVKDRNVFLSGKIGSLAAKNRAEQRSFLPGISKVETGNLTVTPWLDDKDRKETEFIPLTDKEIADTVRDSFFYDPRLTARTVDIEVSDGQVTLKGEVDTLRARNAAEQNTKNTEGVTEVVNLLQISPVVKVEDQRITDIAENTLLLNPYTDGFALQVSVKNGKVSLSGKVPSNFERAKVEEIVSGIEGVRSIDNYITLQKATTDDNQLTAAGKSDAALARDIREEIKWNWYVDSSKIEVEVNSGIATLSGTVESSWQKRSVQEDALLAGAGDVVNNLEVVGSDK